MRSDEPRILYEDDTLLLVDKPAGWLTVPTPRGETKTLHAWASRYAKGRGARKAYLVHRLDRETSGVMAFVKTAAAQRVLEKAFRAHEPTRLYRALVQGILDPPAGCLTHRLVCDPRRRSVERVTRNPRLGVEAVSEYETSERFGDLASLLELRPRTGRTNQLRVQLAHQGHPVVGDRKYSTAGRYRVRARRTLLHAAHLELRHPETGEPVRAEAPPPADFEAAVAALRARVEPR